MTEQKKGTLSIGGTLGVSSGSSASSGGVAVEVRKRRFTSTANQASPLSTASTPTHAVPLDSEMARRMEILQKAEAQKEDETKRRETDRARAETLLKSQAAKVVERKQQELDAEAKRAEEEAARIKQVEEREAAQKIERAANTTAVPAAKPAASAGYSAPAHKTVSADAFRAKKTEGRPQERDESKKRGRNAYMEGLEQRYRSPSRRNSKQRNDNQGSSAEKVIRDVTIPEFITVQELAAQMSEKGGDVVKKLMLMGQMVTLTQSIDQETAALIVEEFGHKYKFVSEDDIEIGLIEADDEAKDLITRPPVVTVMGHVDHGKTSLLDALRKTKVAAGEAGGITQHIGAYQIANKAGRKITFLDTPGHAAFTAMRQRGAQVTDVVILIVAADDGVMPQTIEAIKHAKAAGVPIVVAVNKCDKPDSNPEKVKQELLGHDLVPESYGGDVPCVNISAMTGMGLEELEEVVLLQADMLELKANPNRRADGVVVESRLDKGRGPVATVIIQRGTINVGDIVVAGHCIGRVRALLDDTGVNIKSAGPAAPVEILGLSGVPEAGDTFAAVENEKKAKEVAAHRAAKKREASHAALRANVSLDSIFDRINAGDMQELGVVVKGDVQGSVEAIVESLSKLDTGEVKVKVLHGAVGVITESDVMLASASSGLIVGFNVRAEPSARKIAEANGVEIRYYSVIYNLIDDIKAAMSGMLASDFVEEVTGHAEIRQIFKFGKVKIAGSYVLDGKIKRGDKTRLLRDGKVVYEGAISSLRREKNDVKDVAEGYECGITLDKFDDIVEGDMVEVFKMNEVTKTIDDVKAEEAVKAKAAKVAKAKADEEAELAALEAEEAAEKESK